LVPPPEPEAEGDFRPGHPLRFAATLELAEEVLMSTSLHPPVVVGVDGSRDSRTAVDVAAREADWRDAPLRLVHVYKPAIEVRRSPVTPFDPALALRHARSIALAEADRVATSYKGLRVVPVTVVGDPATTLVDESERATLVVVGSRGPNASRGLFGSVSARVAAHAKAPVMVVRPSTPGDTVRLRKGILVGVDGSAGAQAALDFAFAEAALRGTDLTALYAWTLPPVDNAGVHADPTPDQPQAERMLAEALAGWQEKYPTVAVHRRAVHSREPLSTLRAESSASELVVVGSRGHGAVLGPLLGSVSHGLVRHSPVPVAVAHLNR
jgi:nucleotide-binding universal stress UspA family protein